MFVNYPPIEYINIPKIAVYESVGYSNDIYSNGHTSYLVYSDTPFIVSHDWGTFRNLKDLQIGDEVDLSGEYGWRKYEVKDKVILHYPEETTFENAKYISDRNE